MNRIRLIRRIVSLIAVLSLLSGAVPAALAATEAQTEDVKKLLEEYHLSAPTGEDLNEAAIEGMVDSLQDPYTEYFTDEEWQQFSDYLAQTYVGVGVVSTVDGGKQYVQDVIPGSPAAKAGLAPGDEFVSVNGMNVEGLSLIEMNDLITGDEGTTVRLKVIRDGEAITFTLTRSIVQLPIASSQMLSGGIGYLSLSMFAANAADSFKQELDKLEKAGMKSLIIDLRDNGGGYVDQAQQIAGNFIQAGVLAHLTDREGVDHPISVEGERKKYPIYILVNEDTASASELLAGALQDYGAAKLIGTRTYGKGVVQQIMDVPSGGVLKVTIEEYTTPKGRKVDHTGISPDLEVQDYVQQLFAAIRAAGGRPAVLVAGKGSLVIDGLRMQANDIVTRKNGVPYLDLRLAAAFLGGTVQYDAKSHSISIIFGGKTSRLAVSDSHLIVKDGVSRMDVRLLAKWMPQLRWSDANGLLKLAQL
ncbi:S41 family peptidase [Cohnella lubricantis]|uniref:PDZ domain-containing protein n=1 Tax=Cohnella lubricantis TaxID=2163172 RepID=A0A841TF39_9BACL|nr:S41 family peptidase [Cohnella lubricantis]MBB6679642.1 PDZ domain-containing protein [Cohnella lubricantis]MBP2118584.1 carboxyl-terminal processing protease [Cohnella lubricantis]